MKATRAASATPSKRKLTASRGSTTSAMRRGSSTCQRSDNEPAPMATRAAPGSSASARPSAAPGSQDSHSPSVQPSSRSKASG